MLLLIKVQGQWIYCTTMSRNFPDVCIVRVTKLPHTKQTSVNFEILRSYNIFVGFVQICMWILGLKGLRRSSQPCCPSQKLKQPWKGGYLWFSVCSLISQFRQRVCAVVLLCFRATNGSILWVKETLSWIYISGAIHKIWRGNLAP